MNDNGKKTKEYRNSDYPSGSFEAALKTDRKPQLRLERMPSQETHSREDFEEFVPEFMHRDFFRSEEMPSPMKRPRKIKPNRPDWESDQTEELSPLRASQRTPEKSSERLAPLRAEKVISEPPMTESEEEIAPVRTPRQESPLKEAPVKDENEAVGQPVPPLRTSSSESPTVAPPAAAQAQPTASQMSGALVLVFLVLVSLFIWREQTRPPVVVVPPVQLPAENSGSQPVEPPAAVQPQEPSELEAREESPYPAMSPVMEASEPEVPAVDGTGETASEEAAAERAAILEEAAEAAGVEYQPAPVPQSPPPQQAPQTASPVISEPWRTSGPGDEDTGSMFPQTQPAAQTQVPPVSQPKPPADSGSMFPASPGVGSETAPAPNPGAAVQPPPVKPAAPLPTVEGDPYKIAEPSL